MAIASNTNPHSLGGGAGMPGCVVLVSNLNEKVGNFVYSFRHYIASSCFVCVSDFPLLLTTFSSFVLVGLLSRLPPSFNLFSLQDDYSSCSLHSLWYVLTTL